jgi:hypothetical protein
MRSWKSYRRESRGESGKEELYETAPFHPRRWARVGVFRCLVLGANLGRKSGYRCACAGTPVPPLLPVSKGKTALFAGCCNRRLWQFFKLGVLDHECGEDSFSASDHLQLSASARPNKLIHPRKPEEVVSLRDNKAGRLLSVGGGLQCRHAQCVTSQPEHGGACSPTDLEIGGRAREHVSMATGCDRGCGGWSAECRRRGRGLRPSARPGGLP